MAKEFLRIPKSENDFYSPAQETETFKQMSFDIVPIELPQFESIGDSLSLLRGEMKSPNYSPNQAGWKIDSRGNAEFRSIKVNLGGMFGGDGSDGALSISSGTTTIDLGNSSVVVKNYSSISITGTGKLAFSNPHASGTTIILKSTGDVTLTSSTNPLIELNNAGAAGGAAVGPGGVNGLNGTNGYGNIFNSNLGTGPSTGGPQGTSGAAISTNFLPQTSLFQFICGAGGGSGTSGNTSGSGTSGVGGRGAGSLLMECGGNFNFTGTINGNGGTGGDSTLDGNGGGGGGGGGAGTVIIVYKDLVANTGTINVSGGTGGTGNGQYGGGGGGSWDVGGSEASPNGRSGGAGRQAVMSLS